MPTYPVHTLDSAPAKSRASLERLNETFGLIPNLAATMASSPTLVNGFVAALVSFLGGTLDGRERQVVMLSNAVGNRCTWAVAFHSTAALREGVAPADVQAIRERRLPAALRLAGLSRLVRALVEKRGHLDADDLEACAAASITTEQVLEVIGGLGASMMANYAGNITQPPLEGPFASQRWSP